MDSNNEGLLIKGVFMKNIFKITLALVLLASFTHQIMPAQMKGPKKSNKAQIKQKQTAAAKKRASAVKKQAATAKKRADSLKKQAEQKKKAAQAAQQLRARNEANMRKAIEASKDLARDQATMRKAMADSLADDARLKEKNRQAQLSAQDLHKEQAQAKATQQATEYARLQALNAEKIVKEHERTQNEVNVQSAILSSLAESAKVFPVKTFEQLIAECQPGIAQAGIIKKVVFRRADSQQGAECGYHAVLNSAIMRAELLGQPRPIFDLQVLRNEIAQRRTGVEVGMLNDAEVEHIAEYIRLDQDNYTIIPDVLSLPAHLELIPADHELARIRASISRGIPHAFMLGTMDPVQDYIPGQELRGGHWICVVVTHDSYYVLDSVNGPHQYMINMIRVLDETLGMRQ